MKVVLFCGGMGMRLREYSESVPKPLVPIGDRPIIWNVMAYYAHYGHKDFILCLGYRGHKIKEYFLKYDECQSNDFVFSDGGGKIELLNEDIRDWRITFVDTGMESPIAARLKKVEHLLEGESAFLANYSDAVTNLPLDLFLEDFRQRDKVGSFISVPSPHAFHVVEADESNSVLSMEAISKSSVRINAGYFAFKREIFDYIEEGDELVVESFERLIREKELMTYPFNGFWRAMDTFKDWQQLDAMVGSGDCPWQIWRKPER